MLKEVYSLLLQCARDYLLHRHNVLLDKMFWQKFLDSTDEPVTHLDYSQNIKLVEKNQIQSAHFSGRQHTLHDSLIQQKDKPNTYIYHLSDDTNHDNVMTTEIINSIIQNHPEIVASGTLNLRSDNCSTQYKSKYVFHNFSKIASTLNITINWFFGEAGHGRGLIDAMAWFGCKGPLRKAIVTTDCWFKNAAEMFQFLTETFKYDKTKEYHLVLEEVTANVRCEEREEIPLPRCKKSHVIAFYPNDELKMWESV